MTRAQKRFAFLVAAAACATAAAAPSRSQKPPVIPPRVTKLVKPDCTTGRPCHGLHGLVVVTVDVLADGTVGEANVKSGDKQLGDDAVKAAKQCRFAPGTFNGKPTSMNYDLEYRF